MVKFLTTDGRGESTADWIRYTPANAAADAAINPPLTPIPNVISMPAKYVGVAEAYQLFRRCSLGSDADP